MRNVKNSVKFLFISVTALFLIASCGGGGNGGTTSTTAGAATGTVTLLVTDGPTDDFNAVNLTVTRAELLSDAGDRITLFSGVKRFDLLQLANVTEIFSTAEVPTGSYDKIRLTLTEIELVLKDGTKAYPELPGNGKLDLKPADSFLVTSDNRLMIQLDFDAGKSMHIVRTGNGTSYQFRPVVFIKIIKNSFDTKLVRLQGTVGNLDSLLNEFDLCLIYAQGHFIDDGSQGNRPYCVQVNTTDSKASFFDVEAEPIAFGDLVNGDIVTVAGRIVLDRVYPAAARHRDRDDDKSRDRDDDRSKDDSSSDDDSSDDDSSPPQMVLAAEVVWIGDYLELSGIARSEVTTDSDKGDWFKYEILSGGIVSGAPIPSILQPGSKLFSSTGISLDSSSIQADVPTIVNGVLDLKTGDLKGVLFILDTEVPAKLDQLTGSIGAVEPDFSGLTLLTTGGDRCVNISINNTKVFEASLSTDNNINFTQMTAYDLRSGQQANIFGDELNGCLQADTIIYEEGGASIQPLP